MYPAAAVPLGVLGGHSQTDGVPQGGLWLRVPLLPARAPVHLWRAGAALLWQQIRAMGHQGMLLSPLPVFLLSQALWMYVWNVLSSFSRLLNIVLYWSVAVMVKAYIDELFWLILWQKERAFRFENLTLWTYFIYICLLEASAKILQGYLKPYYPILTIDCNCCVQSFQSIVGCCKQVWFDEPAFRCTL